MKHSDFTEQYHWLCGLEEYYNHKGKGDRYQLVHKALYHDNWYRKRDIMVELYNMERNDPKHIKAWMNVIMHEHLTDIEIKPQLVATLLRKFMQEDPFLASVARFINYWSGENGEAAEMPDINDFLSRGQVKSKLWMIEELKKIVDGPLGNVVFYGGWYNFLAHMIYDELDAFRIYSLDLDENVIEPSKRLYPVEVEESRFIPFTTDVTKLQWRNKGLWYIDYAKRDQQITEWLAEQEETLANKRQTMIDAWLEKQEARYAAEIEIQGHTNKDKIREDIFRDKDKVIEEFSVTLREEIFKNKDEVYENYGWRKLDDMNIVINTSCEHMDNSWFHNLPNGTLVVLQTNDYFSNEQHVNCCHGVEDAKSKYPMTEVLYEGELDTYLYKRFMLIGIK